MGSGLWLGDAACAIYDRERQMAGMAGLHFLAGGLTGAMRGGMAGANMRGEEGGKAGPCTVFVYVTRKGVRIWQSLTQAPRPDRIRDASYQSPKHLYLACHVTPWPSQNTPGPPLYQYTTTTFDSSASTHSTRTAQQTRLNV